MYLTATQIEQAEKELKLLPQQPYSFLTMLYLKKKFYQKFIRQYKKKKSLIYKQTHNIIYFKFLKKNLFISICNDLNQNIRVYSLGLLRVKKKSIRASKQTFKLIFSTLKHNLRIKHIRTLTLCFRGRFHKIKKFYKFFIKQIIYYNLKISINLKRPHGGCRPRKKRRC